MTRTPRLPTRRHIALGAACALTSAIVGALPAHAQDDDSRTTQVVARNVTLHPRTPLEMHQTMARLSEAALQACGAEPFSFGSNRAAIAGSSCFREAMRGAAAQVVAPSTRVARARMP